MPPIAAALPHIVTLLEQINTQLLSLGTLLVIQQMLFSPYKLARNTRSNLLLLGKANNITSQSFPRATSIFLLSAIIQSTEMLSILTFQSALSWSSALITLCADWIWGAKGSRSLTVFMRYMQNQKMEDRFHFWYQFPHQPIAYCCFLSSFCNFLSCWSWSVKTTFLCLASWLC